MDKFSYTDNGVHADGMFGNSYVCLTAISHAARYGFELADTDGEVGGDHEHLGEIADEAVEYLNEHAVRPGMYFSFYEGDLLLIDEYGTCLDFLSDMDTNMIVKMVRALGADIGIRARTAIAHAMEERRSDRGLA